MQLTHTELVEVAAKWLEKTKGCGFVFRDLRTINNETPDAIGFRSGVSILVEAKASRADFLADKKKHFRRRPQTGMGTYRFFLCPEGLIQKEDLPEKWGLIWVNPKRKPRQIVGPKGNIWSHMKDFLFTERNTQAEWQMMYSALRRINKRGNLEQIYEPFETKPQEKPKVKQLRLC